MNAMFGWLVLRLRELQPISWACMAVVAASGLARWIESECDTSGSMISGAVIVVAILICIFVLVPLTRRFLNVRAFYRLEECENRTPESTGLINGISSFAVLFVVSLIWFRLWDRPSRFQNLPLSKTNTVKVVGRVSNLMVTKEPSRFSGKLEDVTKLELRLEAGHRENTRIWCGGVLIGRGKGFHKDLKVGQRVEMVVQRNPVFECSNPGQADFSYWLRSRGYCGACRIIDIQRTSILTEPTWRQAPDILRDRFKTLLLSRIDPSKHGLALSVILGERGLLGNETRDQYVGTGTVHLLAISGLHLGILSIAFLSLLRIRLIHPTIVLFFILIQVWFFAWLVGFRPPILRAALLITVWLVGKIRKKPSLTFHSLAICFFCVFLFHPMGIFLPGTHLSFLAVASILWISKSLIGQNEKDPVERLKLEKRPRWYRVGQAIYEKTKDAYLLTAGVFLICLPLVYHHFHICGWIGILLNPILLIPMAIALFSGFLLLVFDIFGLPFGFAFSVVCNGSLEVVDWIVAFGHSIPLSRFWGPSPGSLWIGLFYLIWCPVLVRGPGGCEKSNRKTKRWLGIGTSFLIVVSFLFPQPTKPLLGMSHGCIAAVSTVDVGHGQCVLVQTASGRNLLFDCGSLGNPRSAGITVSNFLFASGVHRLDTIIISHDDSDHYNGLRILAQRFAIGNILTTRNVFTAVQSPEHQLYGLLNPENTKIICAGDSLDFDSDWNLQVLSPSANPYPDGDNSNSLVVRLSGLGQSILLTGDLEKAGMNELLRTPENPVTICQVPHHGSPNSDPRAFANWSRPEVALVSCGRRFLNDEVMDCYEEAGAQVYSTPKSGAILVRIYEDSPTEILQWKNQQWSVR